MERVRDRERREGLKDESDRQRDVGRVDRDRFYF